MAAVPPPPAFERGIEIPADPLVLDPEAKYNVIAHTVSLPPPPDEDEKTRVEDPEVKDVGWNRDPLEVPSPLVDKLPNEDLHALVRRFNKVLVNGDCVSEDAAFDSNLISKFIMSKLLNTLPQTNWTSRLPRTKSFPPTNYALILNGFI